MTKREASLILGVRYVFSCCFVHLSFCHFVNSFWHCCVNLSLYAHNGCLMISESQEANIR